MPRQPINWDRVYLNTFATQLSDQRKWFETANELVAAAELLAPHVFTWWDSLAEWSKGRGIFLEHGYHSIFMMLYAFAIENLCKGYLVSQYSFEQREAIRVDGQLPTDLKKHDLCQLASKVGLNISLEEEDVLRRLERASVWGGRYPIPDVYSKDRPRKYSDGKVYTMSLLSRADLQRVKTLTQQIRLHVGASASYRVNPDDDG